MFIIEDSENMYKLKTKTPQISYAETVQIKHLVYFLTNLQM